MRESRDIVKMRWWCIRRYDQGWSGDKIAAHLQIPRSTAHYWIDKYEGCRKKEMANRPNKLMMVVDDRTRKFVLRLREKHDWGPCRIERHIRMFEPEGVQPISHNLIYRILVEEGVNQPIDFIRKT
jgi:transposase